jgi:Putative restriction endonuclease
MGKYLVMGEVACRFGHASLPKTDACVYAADIFEAAMEPDEYPTIAPVLAVKVASPGNSKMHTKADFYLENGAAAPATQAALTWNAAPSLLLLGGKSSTFSSAA